MPIFVIVFFSFYLFFLFFFFFFFQAEDGIRDGTVTGVQTCALPILSISQAHLSLDAPLTPGEDNKLLDYLPDTQNPGPDSETFEHALTESIEEVLSTL